MTQEEKDRVKAEGKAVLICDADVPRCCSALLHRSVMTQEEKDRVKAEGKAVAKDKRFVQAIAERTGVYIHYEVRRSHD